MLPLSLPAAIGRPCHDGQFLLHATHSDAISFSVALNPALSVPQKFGYNKKSKNFMRQKKSKKSSNETRHRRLCNEAISALPVRTNTHPGCPKEKEKILTEKQTAMLDFTAYDSVSSSMPTPGNEKSDVLVFVRLFAVADEGLEGSPLSFPRCRRKLRIF